ncbi:N-acetylmuramoyl-L-alanine amidase, family 2 [Plesiocystis pacifica SIR-1]|uniref:N-acetylmuramoyl-L-alanine amidase, family 2 n=1 Tax=Plesiocystis pacifica SIR-1 TaxID=391625 RepID=A6G7Z3_9BACT|nr:N-acetylmuramoyl-L-alanine amidase [Plesiocystis pacifica]EDM77955.1 N-acetylmuramoyl-L-alanine amidase, family 2 [Plesiocystis pacifica SIR-1]
MSALIIGLAPVAVFGVAALWVHARSNRVEIVDLTALAAASKRGKRSRTVDAVVLHQMSFSRGDDLHRYLKVTAHFIIVPNGTIGQLHPMSARLSASDGFNSRSVAIEFAGNLRSVDGGWYRPEDYGRDVLTAAQVLAGRGLLRQLRAAGIRHVYAHRQSSPKRGNDPGPEIWSSVGQWGVDVLGLDDGGDGYAIAAGKPIPDTWRSSTLTL